MLVAPQELGDIAAVQLKRPYRALWLPKAPQAPETWAHLDGLTQTPDQISDDVPLQFFEPNPNLKWFHSHHATFFTWGAYLCAEEGVDIQTRVQGASQGLFGGSGFFLMRCSGRGSVAFGCTGSCIKYELQAGATGLLMLMNYIELPQNDLTVLVRTSKNCFRMFQDVLRNISRNVGWSTMAI